MPLNLRASDKLQEFNVPVSYRIYERRGKFLDARNVNTIQGRLDTRFGSSRFNSVGLSGAVRSLSFFSKSDGSQYLIAKVDNGDTDDLVVVSESGAHSYFGLPLSKTTVHRGITVNDRHIIAIESDGLFSFNGTIGEFSRLGQAAPTGITVAKSAGSGLTADNIYRVGVTFYASSIGFESNAFTADVTPTGTDLRITVSDIPTFALNALVDKVYIYLQDVTGDGELLFIDEIDLGTTSYVISAESTSSQTPPTKNDVPGRNATDLKGGGGGKYLALFNSKLVFSGHSGEPNGVYFSEPDIPDAFDSTDTATVLFATGKGGVTGLAVGLFNDSALDPFLVIFKRKATLIYSEIGGEPKLVPISNEIGCVSNDTIQVKNGVVYFLSEEGWRGISNGRYITNEQGEPITLGNGDIDDIFKSSGYVYEINRNGLPRTFSVYYPTLDQYLTWVSEGTNNAYNKCYNFQFDIGGFIPYEFAVDATCATLGENSSGRDIVLFGTNDGYILKHSTLEPYSDRDSSNTETAINAFAVMPWSPQDGDFDSTYNFRELILKSITSENALTVKHYIDYNLSTAQEFTYDFSDPEDGFELDVDALDEGVLTDGRTIVVKRNDINRVGESIAIGFYQQIIGANLGLIGMQLDASKNGNRNRSIDADEAGDGNFDDEAGSYFPTVTDAVQQCADYLQQIQTLINGFNASFNGISYNGFSDRFDEFFNTADLEETLDQILLITYAAPLVTLTASGSGTVREKGTVVSSSNLTAAVTKRSDPIARIQFFLNAVSIYDENPALNTGSGNTTYAWTGSFSDNSTFSVQVTDDGTSGGPTTVTSSAAFTFVYPYYSGAGAPGLSAANVALLTKDVRVSTASLNKSFTTSNGDVYYFAYPASYGALSSILDENGFETFSDWTLRTENITGLDGNPVSYRIYEFNNPVVAGSTDYTFIR
jgi:hypothetical protein